ncbi:CPBP family intramembrane glutamic endopeptidase [Glutamicibacter endophyticus]|uniref:CPBP family intramembrane glutamic endopeptidase n=1 Tax=Glutamicibacter endophyticus TaxID=1522174 RepID=UPI003AF0AEBA
MARAIVTAVSILVARFVLIQLALWVAPWLGITGWYAGLFANFWCVVAALILVRWLQLGHGQGVMLLWHSRRAAVWLLPFLAEALMWLVAPGDFAMREPGWALWILTLLMVGINEELFHRMAVLSTLRRALGPVASAVLGGALFGLAHLSLLATTSRAVDDVLLNVLASATYGFALAAFQLRFHWLAPLFLVHALADFTVLMTTPAPFAAYLLVHVGFVLLGVLLLRSQPARAGRQSRPVR